MYHFIAVFAAAFGFLTSGHTAQPQHATGGIAMAPNQTSATITRRPMDAIPPFPAN